MMEWFKHLSDTNKIAIVVPVCLAVIVGLFGLLKWLLGKKDGSESKGNTGIDSDNVLDRLERKNEELGQTKEIVRKLEEQLSQPQIMGDTSRQQVPQPTQQAKDLAAQIEDDAGPYALALKAIAGGNTKEANELLDKTQKLLDTVQEQKDQAQAKIYLARLQNASYAGKPQDALPYCDKLKPLAGNDSLILNEIATVYYENANYKEAEPLMRRALTIDEASFGADHPDVATDLNNLAQLLQATNRLKKAEPLMERQLVIFLQFTRRTGHPHPHLKDAINNYGSLLMQMGYSEEQITARLKRLAPEMFD